MEASFHLFRNQGMTEGEVRKLVANHFLPDCAILQWCPTIIEDIPTPNTNEIVVFSSFFQCGFGLLACNFICGLLDHYKIKLVHLNPSSIQLTIFVHLYEAFLGIPPNFPLFKHYFFLCSTTN
jgi:hypothetical protein